MKKRLVLFVLITFVVILSVSTNSVKANIINTSNSENNLLITDNEIIQNCTSENCFEDPIEGGGEYRPDFDGYVPEYLKDNYYIFKNEGSDIYRFNDILVYKYTIKDQFGTYDTYTMSVNVIYQYPRRSYDNPGNASITLKVREHGYYQYVPSRNTVYFINDSPKLKVEDVTMKMEIISDEIAFSESEYYGYAKKPFLSSSDVTYFVKFIPYVGDYAEIILNKVIEDGNKNMDVDYKLTCYYYYSDQEQNYEICNSLNTNSNNYYLKDVGNYLTLSAKLTYKEQEESNNYIRYYYRLSISSIPSIIGYNLPTETYSRSITVSINN